MPGPETSSSRSPLVLGHEIAGTIVGHRWRCAGPRRRRPGRRQPVTLVRPLRSLPGRPVEPVRQHLLHGLGFENAAHARRLCVAVRRDPGAVREDPGPRDVRSRGSGRAARRMPARGGARGRDRRPARPDRRRGADRAVDHAGGTTRRARRGHGRRRRGRAARLRAAGSAPARSSTSQRMPTRWRRSESPIRSMSCSRRAARRPDLPSAVGAARRGGTIVQIGNLPGGSIPFPANAVMAKELDSPRHVPLRRGVFRSGAPDRGGRDRHHGDHLGAPAADRRTGRAAARARPLAEHEGDAGRRAALNRQGQRHDITARIFHIRAVRLPCSKRCDGRG